MKTLLEEVKSRCKNKDEDSLIKLIVGENEEEGEQFWCTIRDVFNYRHLRECRVIKVKGECYYLNVADCYNPFERGEY